MEKIKFDLPSAEPPIIGTQVRFIGALEPVVFNGYTDVGSESDVIEFRSINPKFTVAYRGSIKDLRVNEHGSYSFHKLNVDYKINGGTD